MKGIVGELGNKKSTDFGPRTGDFNVLNVPDELYKSPKQFWNEYNEPWLKNAIDRGDPILMATTPEFGANSLLFRTNDATGKMELSGFGKEYLFLRQNGYSFDAATKQMIRHEIMIDLFKEASKLLDSPIKEFNLSISYIDEYECLISGQNYSLSIALEPDGIEINYIDSTSKDGRSYRLTNYLSTQRFTATDRALFGSPSSKDERAHSSLRVFASGITNQCTDILRGDKTWLEVLKKKDPDSWKGIASPGNQP